MLQIRKRDGTLQEFDLKKIENAIQRAFAAEHKFFNEDITNEAKNWIKNNKYLVTHYKINQ